MLSLIFLLFSNAVSIRRDESILFSITRDKSILFSITRDKSILFSRAVIISLVFSSFITFNNLHINPLAKGIGLYAGLFNVTTFSLTFNLFIFFMTALILTFSVFTFLILIGSFNFDDILGQIYATYIISIADSAPAIGLGILVAFYRLRGSIAIESK